MSVFDLFQFILGILIVLVFIVFLIKIWLRKKSSKFLWIMTGISFFLSVFSRFFFAGLCGPGILLITNIYILVVLCVITGVGISSILLNIPNFLKRENNIIKIIEFVISILLLLFFIFIIKTYITSYIYLCG